MAESFLDVEIAQFLKTSGFGSLHSDPVPVLRRVLHVGEEPESPDHVITVLEEGGGPPILTLAEARSFTVRVRHSDYLTAKETAQRIHRAFQEEQGILSPAIMVARVTANSNPIHLGRDESKRHLFTQTFTALVKQLQP